MSTLRRRIGASRGGDPAAGEARTETEAAGGLTRRMIAASALLALIIGGAFAILLLAIGDLRGAERQSAHAQDVLVATNHLERLLLDLETGVRGFVLTRQERFLAPWNRARLEFPRRTAALRALVTDEPVARREAREIARRERSYLRDYSVPLVNAARRGDPSARSVAATATGKRRVDAMRAVFDRLLETERSTDARSKESANTAARRASAAAAAGVAGSVALIALYAAYLTRAIVRPVRRAAGMAGRLAGGDLSARMPETGAAEIGALERAFNMMGTSLERSRDELAELAAEQAALRRVATLVARGASPAETFSAVATEVGGLFGAEVTVVSRYEPDGAGTIVGGWGVPGMDVPVGARLTLVGSGAAVVVRETGLPTRAERFEGPPGSIPGFFHGLGIRSGVGAPIVVEGRLWGVVVAATTRPDELPAGSENRISGFTELVATAIANAEAQAALTASRARIVASADETRRRIERDLHDGAQQRLVTLALRLRAAQAAVPPELEELQAELDSVATGLTNALDELREFARGIHPAILAERGLASALEALARRSTVPVDLHAHADTRLPEPVEVAAYFIVSEALTNAAKHAHASAVGVDVEAVEGVVRISVRDDGVGGADLRRGSGLVGLKDRVEALGGRIAVESARGTGTSIQVELPLVNDDGVSSG